jgi:hypothetical protein
VKVLVPGEAASSKALPVSEVTVCSVPSSLSTVIVAPGLTEPGVVKLKLLIVMVEAVLPASGEDELADDETAADELDVELDDEPDEPQATSVTAETVARTSRARAWVPDMIRPLCGRSGAGAARTTTRQSPAVQPAAGVRSR